MELELNKLYSCERAARHSNIWA